MAYPEMRFGEMFNVYVIQAVFAVDSSDNTRPMTHYAESPNGISALFDRVAYPKCKYIQARTKMKNNNGQLSNKDSID